MPEPKADKPPSLSTPDAAGLGQLGEYQLLEKLGEGGMGAVYQAVHTELDRVVALKVLPKGRTEDEQAIARFKREMKAVGRLDHPNIVRAYDAREIEGTRVLVMEYVDGLDLAELVQRLGPLPVADACELIRQAAVGLQHAHEHGLVHRDLKPSNLMLTRDKKVKILDLGLAHIQAPWSAGEEVTRLGQVIGTPDYMAPEQASDSHTVDIRADLYSLGCTLYKLLTGQAPFSGPAYQSAFNKMSAHAGQPVPPIRQFRGDLPEQLAAVLDKMLAKAPQLRFSTPAELVEALGQFASGSDLSLLLASAQGRLEALPRQVEPIVESQEATPAPTGTLRDHPPKPWRQPSRARVWWHQPWAIAVGLALLVACAGLALAIIVRPAEHGRVAILPSVGQVAAPPNGRDGVADVEPSNVDNRTKQNQSFLEGWWPGRAAGDLSQRPKRTWLVLSWTPGVEAGKPDLWLFSPDGKSRSRVTHDPNSVDLQPKFSPDGQRIAFIRAESPRSRGAVCVCDTNGRNLRQLVTAEDKSVRFLSPVWVSNSRVYYARDLEYNGSPETEIWQFDLAGKHPRLVFRFQEAFRQAGGVVTDVSPDGQRLAVIAGKAHSPSTADVYITDLKGTLLQTVWEDPEDDHMDARALWSPDGQKIAWHHNFTRGEPSRGSLRKPTYHGVGQAWLGPDGKWTARVQQEEDTLVTPVAWSEDGRALVCARLHEQRLGPCNATLFFMAPQFGGSRYLFELRAHWQQGSQWGVCRLGDWALLPADIPLPPPLKPR